MKQCQIFLLNHGKQELAAVLILHDDNTITGEARHNHPHVLAGLLGDEDQIIYGKGGDAFDRTEDPAGWFDALPYQFHGTYFWAEIKPEGETHERQAALRACLGLAATLSAKDAKQPELCDTAC